MGALEIYEYVSNGSRARVPVLVYITLTLEPVVNYNPLSGDTDMGQCDFWTTTVTYHKFPQAPIFINQAEGKYTAGWTEWQLPVPEIEPQPTCSQLGMLTTTP